MLNHIQYSNNNSKKFVYCHTGRKKNKKKKKK